MNLYPELTPLTEHCGHATIGTEGMTLIVLTNNDRKSIDAWINFGIELRQSWDVNKKMLILVDMSQTTFSRYARERARDMIAVRPEVVESVAVVMPDTVFGRLIEAGMNAASSLIRASVRVFHNREDAYHWLQKSYIEHEAKVNV